MPTTEQIKQYLTLVLLPLVAGVLSNWLLVHVHLLAAFHLTAGPLAQAIAQLGSLGVGAALAFLAAHHILKGTYLPAPVVPATNVSSSVAFATPVRPLPGTGSFVERPGPASLENRAPGKAPPENS